MLVFDGVRPEIAGRGKKRLWLACAEQLLLDFYPDLSAPSPRGPDEFFVNVLSDADEGRGQCLWPPSQSLHLALLWLALSAGLSVSVPSTWPGHQTGPLSTSFTPTAGILNVR